MAEEQYDKFIERLQSSDERQQPEMPAAAWEKMEAKLEDAFGKKKKRRRFFWLLILVPLLVTGGYFSSMLGVKTNSEDNPSGLQRAGQSLPVSEKAAGTSTAKAKSDSTIRSSISHERSNVDNTVGIAQSNKTEMQPIVNKKGIREHKNVQGSASPLVSNRNRALPYRNKPLSSGFDYLSKQNSLPVVTKQTGGREYPAPTSAATEAFPMVVDATPHEFPADSFHLSNPLVLDKTAVSLDLAAEMQKTKSPAKPGPRFFAGLSGMYTASGVSLSRAGKGTPGYGFQLGVLWKRFSIAAGVNAGNVIYSARGEEYSLKQSYNPYGYILQSVDAKCYILDIPVVANYIFPTKRRTSFFAGLGVASQLIKRESYDYVSVRNTMTWKGTWSYKNQSKHSLSLLQIDAGINHPFGKTFFLQARPFFRTPLKGIGQGSVHLRTVGLQASLNFFPFPAKNK